MCAVAVTAAGAPSRAFIRRRKAPKAPWLRCRPWAAKRNAVAARLTPGRVRLDFTRPPVFLQLGHSPSQLQNCFTVGNFDTPGPISLMIVSPALKDAKNTGDKHYCLPATASAVTGAVTERDGKKWITATRIEPCQLKFPARMLAADKPRVMPSRDPLLLKVGDKQTLKCVHIPAGKFLMGTPFYMWPYHVEEYPHLVTLTRDYYLAEIPVTQEMYEAVMGENPSLVKDPQLPVQNPTFRDIQTFRDILSEANG